MSTEPIHDDDTPVSDPQPNFRTKPVSFVRRGARLSAGRQRAWDNYRDEFVIDVPRHIADTSVDPDYVFDAGTAFGREAPLIVEIGSGVGEAVIEAAREHPEQNFLAIEVYTPGIAQTLMQIGRHGLSNIRLIQANAPEVLETTLPPSSVDELWVFFPDPWHKARHHKRRMVSPHFAELAERVLKPGGLWRLATDWADYAEVMREVGDGASGFTNLHAGERTSAEDMEGGWAPRFEGRTLTGFEKKAGEAGRNIHDLTYRRTSGA
ncbi:MAG TPA: tRNA (guanosine(46)-N7)-methyltransferase TrmB [Arthrobacter sp.]|nr:tRNA (guanosine(46)-N7)-methyltransferase TrmB [Arthrobacter sp.]